MQRGILNSHSRRVLVVQFKVTIIFTLLSFLIDYTYSKSGQLVLIEKAGESVEKVLNSKECNSGLFFQKHTSFHCACITGVWAFYQEFCEKPVMIIGGDEFCFNMASAGKLAQAAIVGSYRYPFEPSISYFQNTDFVLLTATIDASDYVPSNLDALGGWITVMDEPWTLYSDGNTSLCLEPTLSVHRIFCVFAQRLQARIFSDQKWNFIVKVRKGCHSSESVKADHCYPIRPSNIREGCGTPPKLDPCPSPDELSGQPPNTANLDPDCHDGGMHGRGMDFDLGIPDGWFAKPVVESVTEEPEPPPPPLECVELSRETVREYWLDPANNECGKSIVEAVFRDQLQRFAVTRLDKIFDSRLESLEQMKQLVYRSRDIMKRTCGRDYVPEEFLDVATDAFMMFVNEDFFYGVEGTTPEDFGRILKSLEKCYKRAKLFVFETYSLGCDLKKINGGLILPGKTVNLTIPDNIKSKNYETLIETAWKIFLNAHSYCFEDFQFPNDHHLFSTMFLELFSRSIYEKWIEPLVNKQLYKLILPNFELREEIMENLDSCVAAVKHVSDCPVWLHRSSPNSKPILAGDSYLKLKNDDGIKGKREGSLSRKKRNWVGNIEIARKQARIWDETTYCLQFMEEASVSLALDGCNEIF